ncbi:MAG: acyl-CoA dehydrogenase family protein, partial [Proteobacteria bacterium]|nr:acyl-CoA dehydrogenase family protein [Pseudomonadota bacterium]
RTSCCPSGQVRSHCQQVRRFTREVLILHEPRLEDEAAVPDEVLQQIRDIGLFAISIPEEYGGLNFSMEQQVKLTFEFTQASAVYRSVFSTTIGLCSQALLDFGRDDQRQRYLPGMATGNVIGAFALTEPEAGTDAGALTTSVLHEGDHYDQWNKALHHQRALCWRLSADGPD